MTRPVFRPKLFETLQGYNRQRFASDLGAGVTVSVVALPLAMAFGIASGLTPQTGLVAAIVGGFLISALGGSRVQIGGPAGAFVVIVYGMVQTLGVQGLMLATLLSGVWLGLMGLLRLGVLIRFIPVAVIIGFTNGIAVLIALSQLRTFTGMQSTLTQSDSGAIVHDLLQHWNQIDLWSLGLNLATLLLLVTWQWGLPRWLPSRWSTKLARVPGPMVALCLVSAWVAFWDWPVQTIGQKFGAMRLNEGLWHWPEWRWAAVEAAFPASLTLALLGAIESLLCARVADNLCQDRHDPNQELMAQGLANMAMPFVGGMPVTGTMARTATNAKNGATSPVAGMVHALGLLLLVGFAAPLVMAVPLGTLSAILLLAAWQMGDWRALAELKQFRWPYRITMCLVFGLTVMVDLTVAIEVGLVAACLTFIYRVSNLTQCELVNESTEQQTWAVRGILFFGAVDLITEWTERLPQQALTLDLSGVIYIDATGADALSSLWQRCEREGVRLQWMGLNPQPQDILTRVGLLARWSQP